MNHTRERIDEALRGLGAELDRQAWRHEHAVAGRPPAIRPRPAPVPRRLLAAAVAATVLAGAGGLWVARRGAGPASVVESTPMSPPESLPSEPPDQAAEAPAMLLAPDEDDPAVSLVTVTRSSGGDAAEAAAITADGTAVGITVQRRICPLAMGPTCGDTLGSPTFNAGSNVVVGPSGEGDEVAAGSRLYLVHGTNFSITVTAPALTADVRRMLATLHESPTGVVVPLPPGAINLGGGNRAGQITMELQADGRAARLDQLVGVPVGSYLGSLMLGIPTATAIGDVPAWFMDGSNTFGGGWGFLAFEDSGTAVVLGLAGGTEAELIDLAERLSWVERDRLVDAAPESPAPGGGGAPTIELLSSS